MSSSKEYRDYILEQLSELPGIACRPMMGEFLLYLDGVLFGGIYNDRLLVKIVPETKEYQMSKEIPYPKGKPMYLIEEVDNKDLLQEIIIKTKGGLANGKR